MREVDESVSWSISPQECERRRKDGDPFVLVDVRESEEVRLVSLGGRWIPLAELPRRLEEIDPDAEVIVYCHHGIRSAHAVGFLRDRGYSKARNLSGGIDRWAAEVDPTLPRY